jgi:dienelactone hydrolase
VSWYEAAAYTEYAGKSLPTMYHWFQAAGPQTSPAMVPLSNFAGRGAAGVGTYPGVSLRGVHDLAGNHREWTWTETRGRRYALGGAWNEPSYFLMESEARPPFDRDPENGFRCVKYQDGKIPPARYAGTLDKSFRDYSREKPASDEAFRIFGSFYPRDTGPLEARVESEDASPENWRKLKVSYSAGYGGERLPAYLFLPKNAVPPYQAVVWFPGAGALQVRKSDALDASIDFVIQSGRAVLYPIYKGTYERDAGLAVGHQSRESVTWWLSEVRRSVDYLESRPDIDAGRIAYASRSWGARLASIFLAMEPRLRAAVLFSGGYNLVSRSPEIDDFNFTPRVKAPVLMINGRYDFVFPLETSAAQMFRRLGTPADQKRQVVIESGHDVWTMRGTVTRDPGLVRPLPRPRRTGNQRDRPSGAGHGGHAPCRVYLPRRILRSALRRDGYPSLAEATTIAGGPGARASRPPCACGRCSEEGLPTGRRPDRRRY